ncbi:glycosyltransferase [Flavobacterium sp.]|uniref:glycosyltransferase n=1 Tax=Flavobacterium sp. TaxID=239 RepID=UPI0035293661
MYFLFYSYNIFSIVAIVALFAYAVTIYLLLIGFTKTKNFVATNMLPKTTFSIVVPFRNEKENLPKLLNAIAKLQYPKDFFEVLLVDDDSDDGYSLDVENWQFAIQVIKSERKTNSPKKDAITTAISIAKNNWIITTDADCVVPQNWLKTIDNYIQTTYKKMVVAPVKYENRTGFLHQFQQLDFLSLQATTIGSFGLQIPFLCNGANFAYEKAFFYTLNGFKGNDSIASGDDIFLLQKAVQFNKKLVGYCKNNGCVVVTQSVASWQNLFQQRVRWASKTTKSKLFAARAIAFSVFLLNFIIVLGVFYVPFLMLVVMLIKLILDGLFLRTAAGFLKVALKGFVFSFLLYPFFSAVVAVYSLFGRFNWKGRRFRK